MATPFTYERKELLLTVDSVSVSRGGVPVLKDVDVQIRNVVRPGMEQGQIVGLLGPSGVGKTTLFKVMAGLLEPNAGRVLVGPQQKPVSPGDVGVVAQNYPLLGHRTVRDNLVYAAKMSGRLNKDIIDRMLTEFGLIEHGDKYPIQLSGGQRQRAAIAQQLLCSEHFLIMDEPFSGLDVVALAKVRKLLLDVSTRAEENTFIIVTHDVTSAVSICDTIWLMGRDRDAKGGIIPGAYITEEIDLIERGICWQHETLNRPEAHALIQEIKQKFLEL